MYILKHYHNYIQITITWAIYLTLLHVIGITASKDIEPKINDSYFLPKNHLTYGETFRSNLPQVRWDSFWYIHIAKNGYSNQKLHKNQNNTAFFPLYPMLIATTHYVTKMDYAYSAVWISRIAFLLLLYCFFYYVCTYIRSHDPWMSLYALMFFPTSYLFTTAYTESLFATCVCLVFIFSYKKNILATSIFTFLAGVLRPTAITLFPVLIAFFYKNYGSKKSLKSFIKEALPVLFLLTGILFVFTHHKIVFGRFFQFFDIQQAWDNKISTNFLWSNIDLTKKIYSTFKDQPFFFNRHQLDLLSNVLLLFASYKLWRWKYFPESLFALTCFFSNSFRPILENASRFVIVCVPFFLLISHKRFSPFCKKVLLGCCFFLQCYFWIYFTLFIPPHP